MVSEECSSFFYLHNSDFNMFGKKKNEDYSVKTVKVGVDKLTTIALGTMVKGTITVEGDLRLDGIIEGNVSCSFSVLD